MSKVPSNEFTPDETLSGHKAASILGLTVLYPKVRQSTVETLLRCPREFLYRYRFGLRLKVTRRSRAMDVGTFAHAFLEDFFAGLDDLHTVTRLSSQMEELLGNLLPTGDDCMDIGSMQEYGAVSKAMEQDLATARAMFLEFANAYPPDPRFTTIGLEQTHSMIIPEVGGELEGTLDQILEDKDTKELWIVDHKTIGGNTTTRASCINFELQPRVYRLLASDLYRDRKIVGVVHNIIKRPSITLCDEDRDFQWVDHVLKSGPRKGQTITKKVYDEDSVPKFDNYVARTRRWYRCEGEYLLDREECMKNPRMLQSWVRFDEPVLSKEFLGILGLAANASRCAPTLSKFYRRSSSCFQWNRPCDFLDLCQSHTSQMKGMVATLYERDADQ